MALKCLSRFCVSPKQLSPLLMPINRMVLVRLGMASEFANSIRTDTVGHFPTLSSCGIWDQGGEF